MNEAKIVAIMGPTASGKTAAAVAIADQLPVQVISVDSALIYKEMEIGTSKPDKNTLRDVPHKLINLCEPTSNYSVGRFRKDVLYEIKRSFEQKKTPLLVGGTMLYFNALFNGLAKLPTGDSAIRLQLEKEIQAMGLPALYQRLKTIDSIAAHKIMPSDPQRIMRALEVYQLSGVPISTWWHQQSDKFPYKVLKIAISPTDRTLLHARIAQRFQAMVDQGLENELVQLREKYDLHQDMPSMRCVGYRQMWEYIEGISTHQEMIQKGIVATRQLAKRQLTWLRKDQELVWVDSSKDDYVDEIRCLVENYLKS